MRILVIGSNNANSRMVFSALDATHKETKIERVFVGASSAADRLAIMWAMANGAAAVDRPRIRHNGVDQGLWTPQRMDACLCFAPGRDSARYAQIAKSLGSEVTYYF